MISTFSGGYLLFALLLVAMCSIILGMGMSTTADYITVSTLAVPALYMLGVNPLSAHMFAMYFACLSMISPPVALTAYSAAGIARSGIMCAWNYFTKKTVSASKTAGDI